MGLKTLLDQHALPLLSGVLVNVILWLINKYPVVQEVTGLSEGQLTSFVILLLSYLLSLADLQWSKKAWWTTQTVDSD